MKRAVKLGLSVAMVLAVAGLVFWIQAPKDARAQSSGCALATLKGDYIYGYDGYTMGSGQQTPYAFGGRESYDGAGDMTGVYSGSVGGQISRDVHYTGTYTVNNDCTGTLQTIEPDGAVLNFDIFIDPSTGNFQFTAVDDGEVNTGLNVKVQ